MSIYKQPHPFAPSCATCTAGAVWLPTLCACAGDAAKRPGRPRSQHRQRLRRWCNEPPRTTAAAIARIPA